MKPYRIKDTTIFYDFLIETGSEAAINYLLKGDIGNLDDFVRECTRFVNEWNLDSIIVSRFATAIGKLYETLNSRLLMEKIFGEFDIQQARVPLPYESILPIIRRKITAPSWLKPLYTDPRILYLTILTGHAVNLDYGLTKDLISNNSRLYALVKEVWDNAMDELHPFQRGPTHQGSRHCGNVQYYLHELFGTLTIYGEVNNTIEDVTEDVRAMLSISAALHDIGKGDILALPPPADAHAQSGAKTIRDIPNDLKVLTGCKEFIAKIVDSHNSEHRGAIINNLLSNFTFETYRNSHINPIQVKIVAADMKKLCAIFQMADVMDLTKDRVSLPIAKMLEAMYDDKRISHPVLASFTSNYKLVKKIIDVRKAIDNVLFDRINNIIRATSLCPSTSSEYKSIDERIKKENEDLKETGAENILQGCGLPSQITFP